MIRLIAVAFALALASSVEAMPPVSTQSSDQLVTQVRAGCGVGMVPRAGVCVPRGSVAAAAAGYGSSTNLTPGYASSPGYGYGPGPGPGPGYAYGPGPGPGYGSSTNLTPGYENRLGYGYGPQHDLGGPMRSGTMCWKDEGSRTQAQFGYWAACPK
jgi:hypothetical protein